MALRSLRHQVGVVFEESFLFSDTVRANIAYGRTDATDAVSYTHLDVYKRQDFTSSDRWDYASVPRHPLVRR